MDFFTDYCTLHQKKKESNFFQIISQSFSFSSLPLLFTGDKGVKNQNAFF